MVTARFKLLPFPLPDHVDVVLSPLGSVPIARVPVEELSPETLGELCDEFREQLFALVNDRLNGGKQA